MVETRLIRLDELPHGPFLMRNMGQVVAAEVIGGTLLRVGTYAYDDLERLAGIGWQWTDVQTDACWKPLTVPVEVDWNLPLECDPPISEVGASVVRASDDGSVVEVRLGNRIQSQVFIYRRDGTPLAPYLPKIRNQ